MTEATQSPPLSARDFASSQEVRWCPGCGDYAILKSMQKTLADIGASRENTVFVSGIGCAARFPYYMSTYGFHTIHGRAPAIATGLKLANPDLDIWVISGDGDALSIGGNHTLHVLRRNVNLQILLFNNEIYGLTKGQASPTTLQGTVTNSTPYGKLETPIDPLELYLTLGVTYIASSYSVKPRDLAKLIFDGMDHPGFSIVHVQSPCTTYNDTFEVLKGNKKKGIDPTAWTIPDDHDPSDRAQARAIIEQGGVLLGVIYHDKTRASFDAGADDVRERASHKDVATLLAAYDL